MTREIRITRAAGVISLAALALAALALTDISHGEADVRLEWRIVQAALPIMLVFHVLSLRNLR
jgi:hypothetical protein